MELPLVNKVAESGIVTLDLAQHLLPDDAVVPFDLQPYLFRGLILREKDYREALKTADFSPYAGKIAAVFCSADAIIPVWAYALAAVHLRPVAADVSFGTPEAVRSAALAAHLKETLRPDEYAGKRVVLKGCGDVEIPAQAYVTATSLLHPVVQSLMYGEPCSTVPLYKAKRPAAAEAPKQA